MSLSDAFQILARRWLLLLLVPLVLGVSTYYFGRHLPKLYSSNTTIYTGIASGYTLSGSAAADYNTTNNAFDNLINLITARSTKEEVIYQLLANHLWLTSQQPALLTAEPYDKLQASLPATLRQDLIGSSELATLQNVRRYAQANNTNALYKLLNSANSTYSLGTLVHLTAARIGSSDLIKLELDSYNPELCRHMLALVTQVFLEQSKNLRKGQTASVIQYYEAELDRAKARLAKAEAENLAFNRDNNIINYEAQSKNATTEKEALANEITQISQQYAGAQAALKAVNQKLGNQKLALASNRQILEQRQRLSRLNATIADQQLFGQDPGTSTVAKTQQLQNEAAGIVQDLQNNVDNYYAHSNSAAGITNKDLLTEWVQDMVQMESNRAKLTVLTRRQQDFDREYQRMAPLGATLKRIEREIELAEKSYLATLSSLNASKASQQNTQLTANLKIIDPPNLPLQPTSNKLLLLVLVSSLGGFIFTTSIILGLGLLDKSLKTPAVATRRTGLPVAGIMLDAHAKPTKQLQASQQRSLDQLVRHILLKANTSSSPSPFVVGVFSVQRQEGKTTLCQTLAQQCHKMGVQTLSLYPDSNEMSDFGEAPSLFYPSEAAAVQGWPLDQLIQHAIPKQMMETSSLSVQIIFLEFPALREDALPVGVLRQLNLVFLTVPANRAWRLTDHQTVERLRSATTAPVEVVLSGVSAQNTEEALR